jgi:hypothetical protein
MMSSHLTRRALVLGGAAAAVCVSPAATGKAHDVVLVRLGAEGAGALAARLARLIDEIAAFGPVPAVITFAIDACGLAEAEIDALSARGARIGATIAFSAPDSARTATPADVVERSA